MPGCKTIPFKRMADLKRHYAYMHGPEEQKVSYYCDYPQCRRQTKPFHRKDHLRSHFRGCHKELIVKRWETICTRYDEHHNIGKWKRCRSCLERVMVGLKCSGCKDVGGRLEAGLKRRK